MSCLANDCRVTIRLLPEKAKVYEEFKNVVTKKLHSDVCYVTTELMETFVKAVNQLPNEPSSPVELRFFKQNVQINMGCNFNYYTKKARRDTHDTPESATVEKNHVFPEVANQFPNLKQESREFWLEVFRAEGIILDPSVSTRTSEGIIKKICSLWHHCMTFVTGLFSL